MYRNSPWTRLWVRGGILGLLLAVLGTCGIVPIADDPAPALAPRRLFVGLWITRWDIQSEPDAIRAIRDADELGVTDVFWQVRGSFDAFYADAKEPWGEWILDSDQIRDPGFDPLAVAVREAHARGLRIHAWVNALPLWRGKDPPRDPAHPLLSHPEWRMRDANGDAEPLADGYVLANPVLEEVQDHIVSVCRDIVSRYAVDGLHLDYIRFSPGVTDDPMQYPTDLATRAQFERLAGPLDLETPSGQRAYRAWIRDRITTLVRRIGLEAREASPGIEFSAAVWRHPKIARETYLQDSPRWLQEGLIDRAIPMIYTNDEAQVTGDWSAWREVRERGADHAGLLTIGLGVYKHRAGETAAQLALAPGSRGICLFGYSAMFESREPFQDRSGEAHELRESRRSSMARLISGLELISHKPR